MNLEQHKLLECREMGATTSFYRKPVVDKDWYLLEIESYFEIRIIHISKFKNDLEDKAEEYNELAKEDAGKLKAPRHVYIVKTLEKGFYDKETTDDCRSQN